ncbi:PASTA domain-containing protein [Streptomyces sp. TRM68416]|uniref:PASTA domain-containing protein n=1 Tax=Streptomyces sp. TRM68416 TaxID=2758412 RepID=UPI001CB6CC8C|nr:PASTA domain-containing protein [Streptomyces sp. TRM68416]
MRIRTIAAALAAAALLALTACASTDEGPSKPETTAEDTSAEDTSGRTEQDGGATGTDTEAPSDAPGTDETEADTATLPNLVGMDLQAAQDEAQAAGFYALDDQDASGQGRLQVLDRNWTVCSQDPEPGNHPTDTLVTLYAVKDTETC